MENILDLKTYSKYKSLFDDGLILVPDDTLSTAINDVLGAYRAKPFMKEGEVHEVTLKAGKKVRITSRGSLRDIEIDGITYDSIEQAACNIYDPYNEYYDIYYEIRNNVTDFTFIPIVDPKHDNIRYTISKYSKGLSKYFDPHKVIKAVYSIDNILFYVKDDKDILRKYYFRIGSFNMNDALPMIVKAHAQKNGMDTPIYLAFFYREEDLPFTVGACKEDFYALKDILNRISFKGTTPLKYLIFNQLKKTDAKKMYEKEDIAFNQAIYLKNINVRQFCKQIDISEDDLTKLINEEIYNIKTNSGTEFTKNHLMKYLNILDNIRELKYYEEQNLMWRVKYNDIPSSL